MSTFLPQEVWHIVCEFLPLHTLQYFDISNKLLYSFIKKYYPNISYNKNICYKNILLQLINLPSCFVLLFYKDYLNKKLIIIENNINSRVFITFNPDAVDQCSMNKMFQCNDCNIKDISIFNKKIIKDDKCTHAIQYLPHSLSVISNGNSGIIGFYLTDIKNCPNIITDYNFVFDDNDLKQIYKNIILIDNRVCSYFYKKEKRFAIAYKPT